MTDARVAPRLDGAPARAEAGAEARGVPGRAQPAAAVAWSPAGLRVLLSATVAWQLVQGFRRPLDGFEMSYWLVSYRHGFVRRGLTGAVLALFARPTPGTVHLAAGVVSLAAAAALLAVVEMLIRHGTPASWSLAVLTAASPFAFDFVSSQRRPDQLGIVLLALLGAALRSDRWRTPLCGAVGVALGAVVLMHEGVVLYVVPAAIVMVVVGRSRTADRRRLIGTVALVTVPAAVALAAALTVGRATAATTAALRGDAVGFRLTGLTMFDVLPDSVRGSVARVVHGGIHANQLAMLFSGAALLLAHALWVRRWHTGAVLARARGLVGPALGAVLAAGVVGGGLVLFLTGIDWLRWFCALGCAGLVAAGFAVPALEPRPAVRPARVALPLLLPAAGLCLALISPLPTAARARAILRLLVPRA